MLRLSLRQFNRDMTLGGPAGSIYRPTYEDRHAKLRESFVYWLQYFVGGKRERENTRSESFEDAKNLLKMREGDVGSGRLTAASHGVLLFNDLLDDVVTDYKVILITRCSPST